MPKSKTHSARRVKLGKKAQKQEKWVAKKVAAFNALPEEAKQGLLKKWRFGNAGEPAAQIGGLIALPAEEEEEE